MVDNFVIVFMPFYFSSFIHTFLNTFSFWKQDL